MSRQKQTAWGRVRSGSAMSRVSHWPAITFLILPCTPQPLSQNLVDLVAEPDVLAGPSVALKKEKELFFSRLQSWRPNLAPLKREVLAEATVSGLSSQWWCSRFLVLQDEGKHDHSGCISKRWEGNTGPVSGLTAHFSCTHTCEGSGAYVSEEEKALTWSLCPVRRVCNRGHNTRVWWLRLLGAGQACMAAKELHYDGNRRFTLFLSERIAGRILTELKQKGLCGSRDARLAAASPLWNRLHCRRHLMESMFGCLMNY